MRKNLSKRVWALTLCVALMCAFIPQGVFAVQGVPDGHWATIAINFASGKGYVQGDQNGNINPDAPMSRAQYATILCRMLGLTVDKVTESSFEDVDPNEWYGPYIEALFKKGVIKGTSETTFSPMANVTREESVVLLARAWSISRTTRIKPAFKDELSISNWAINDVRSMQEANFIKGDDKGNFNPQNSVTLGEMCQMSYNKNIATSSSATPIYSNSSSSSSSSSSSDSDKIDKSGYSSKDISRVRVVSNSNDEIEFYYEGSKNLKPKDIQVTFEQSMPKAADEKVLKVKDLDNPDPNDKHRWVITLSTAFKSNVAGTVKVNDVGDTGNVDFSDLGAEVKFQGLNELTNTASDSVVVKDSAIIEIKFNDDVWANSKSTVDFDVDDLGRTGKAFTINSKDLAGATFTHAANTIEIDLTNSAITNGTYTLTIDKTKIFDDEGTKGVDKVTYKFIIAEVAKLEFDSAKAVLNLTDGDPVKVTGPEDIRIRALDSKGNVIQGAKIEATVVGSDWNLGGTTTQFTNNIGIAKFSGLTANLDAPAVPVSGVKIRFTSNGKSIETDGFDIN